MSLPRFQWLTCVRISQGVWFLLVSPHVFSRYRNINRFPFPQVRLRLRLGPTNCQMINIAGKPLPFRRLGILTQLRCYSHQDFHFLTVQRISRPHFYPLRTPSYHILFRILGLGNQLSVFHFRSLKPRLVNCYVLFKGWLFLSLSPNCLRIQTSFSV